MKYFLLIIAIIPFFSFAKKVCTKDSIRITNENENTAVILNKLDQKDNYLYHYLKNGKTQTKQVLILYHKNNKDIVFTEQVNINFLFLIRINKKGMVIHEYSNNSRLKLECYFK